MPEIFIWLAVFIVSLYALIKASDYFIDAAETISRAIGIPPFIIGVTIVALGTSFPELMSSIIAVLEDSSEIVTGNVVGSNIANVFLVLGTIAVVGWKIELDFEVQRVDLIVFFASAIALWLALYDYVFDVWEGVAFLVALIVYLTYTIIMGKKNGNDNKNADADDNQIPPPTIQFATIATLIVSLIIIPLSANYNITSIIKLSEILNIGKDIIALSAVAIGTSLPELFVSISAVRKGNPEMALGNVLGSNIFNILAVMSISSFIGVLKVEPLIADFCVPVMLVATFLYYFFVRDKKIMWWEGFILLSFYVLFIFKVFGDTLTGI
ncbi:MAG: calcium/sodium antiporter [Chitinophagales bacterium]